MTTLAQRLKQEMEKTGLKQEELAQKAGVSQALIHKLVSGKALESRKISKIAAALGVNTDWLANGGDFIEGVVIVRELQGPQNIESNGDFAHEIRRMVKVPVVGTAQLGDNGYWSEIEYPVGHGDGYINYPTNDANAYAIRCRGDSMKPRIKDGEFVIVEPNTEPRPGDEVVVKSYDGRAMVKTLLFIRDGRVHLMSINEAHPPQSIPLEEVEKMHYVAATARKGAWHQD
ncbi:MAG: XRE family transcriptional regulator [Methylobacter sp.]